MTEEEKRRAAEHYLARLLSAKHCRKELEARVRFHEHAAALLGCPDLDKLTPTGRHFEGLAILRELRAELLAEIGKAAADLERLAQAAQISPRVEAVVLHYLNGWTWDKVAARMFFSHTYVRHLARDGLLIVYALFVAPSDCPETAQSPDYEPSGYLMPPDGSELLDGLEPFAS